MFHAVEIMPKERILEYLRKVLIDLCSSNDRLENRDFDYPRNKVQLSLDEKKSNSRLKNVEATVEAIDPFRSTQTVASIVENLVEKIKLTNPDINNLTIIIALVYLDRISLELNIYCTSETILRLFSACLIVASKMHRNEISREILAQNFEIPIENLLRIESAITECIQNLAVRPQTLSEYVKPLLGGALWGNRLEAPKNARVAIQPPPPPSPPPS